MKAELVNGNTIEFDTELLKQLTYQRVTDTRYYLVLGNRLQAEKYEITKHSYTLLVKEVLGEGRSQTILQTDGENKRNKSRVRKNPVHDE